MGRKILQLRNALTSILYNDILWVSQRLIHTMKGDIKMDKWTCLVCGYVYDPEEGDPDNGVAPGTAFDDIPEDWVCPLCGVGKDEFEKM